MKKIFFKLKCFINKNEIKKAIDLEKKRFYYNVSQSI